MPEMDWGPVWLTLQLAGVTVVVLLIVGTPVAWWLAYTPSRWKSIIEAIVALPLNMFYNTGIASFIWVLRYRKPDQRKG